MTDFPQNLEDVEAAVVAHNNRAALPDALASLVEAGCPADRITVVDIASTDGTSDWLRQDWPAVRVRRIERNDGPNPGRNIGITEGTSRFLLLMDADVRVRRDTVELLHAAMLADSTVKVGSPLVVRADSPEIIQYGGGAVHYICEAVNRWRDRPLAERGVDPQDIGAAPACALLIDRQTAIDVGLFDERYFMGKEDGDFLHRLRMAGFVIREVPRAIAVHHSRPRKSRLFYYQIRNRWHFILKNYQLRTIVCLVPALVVYEPLQFLVLAAKGHAWTYVRAVGGLLEMLPTLPRDRAFNRRIRRKRDRDLLVSQPIVVGDALAANVVVRAGKGLYERMLDAYWIFLKSISL